MQCCLEPLRQHCTSENPIQYYPGGSRQLCLRKNPLQTCLNALGITLHRSRSYAKFSKWLRTLHRDLTCSMLSRSIKKTLQKIFPYAKLSGTSRTTLYKVWTCAMLPQEY